MHNGARHFCSITATLLSPFVGLASTSAPQMPPTFASVAPIVFDTSGPVIRAHTQSEKPFTVAGERGVILGQQNGTFEAWVLPVKLLSHLTIEAEIEGYTVPIDVNQQAGEIEVRPDRTVITYSHIGFTLRQIMFSPDGARSDSSRPVGDGDQTAGTGPIILFEFDCLHPTDFTFRFTPELRWMWPERNEGVPSAEWVSPDPLDKTAAGGFYVLHSDYPDLAGAITIPGTRPGILAPYQERPQVHAVELKLHIDPERDRGRFFPLLMAAGMDRASATNAALGATLSQLKASIASVYQSHADRCKKLLVGSVSIETPDKALNEAFQWAVVSIEQLKAKVKGTGASADGVSRPDSTPGSAPGFLHDTDETALVAGYYASGDSARPGFGWFFGRDSLYTLYAVNGYGDFALSKSELEFLIHRQRADGKIMHEYSQTAAAVPWQSFPYMYAAADSTPLFLMAVADYVRASGDNTFLTTHRDAIERAWAFECDPAHDTDHDGIYDNSQGTGWVESWPGGMPHQEIYLALLDQQASAAMTTIERLLHDPAKADAAQQRAEKISKTINAEYYDPQKDCYAFATNPQGTPHSPVDHTATVYPAVAWWDPENGNAILDHPEGCLSHFMAEGLNTDWGLRDVADNEPIYDGMSYHQGSVWPLFTGWAALAEYRGGQPLAGYQLLMENANLTRAQDLGAVTELLSGDFFVPFGRSTSHQLWSSAMVITPTLRGLFGISVDAQAKTITMNPHLPPTWDHAEIKTFPIGAERVDLSITQQQGEIILSSDCLPGSGIKLRSDVQGAKQESDCRLSIPRDPVEVGFPVQSPVPGSRAASPRILREKYGRRQLTLALQGLAGTEARFPVVEIERNVKLTAEGAELPISAEGKSTTAALASPMMIVHFPPGSGWQTITVTLSW